MKTVKSPLELAWEALLVAREEAYVAWYKSGSAGNTPRYRAALAELLKARDGFDEIKTVDKEV